MGYRLCIVPNDPWAKGDCAQTLRPGPAHTIRDSLGSSPRSEGLTTCAGLAQSVHLRGCLQNQHAILEARVVESRSMINALRNRSPDAPFTAGDAWPAKDIALAPVALERAALQRRPELAEMQAMRRERQAMSQLMRREARAMFRVGAWYNDMLMMGDSAGVMVSASLPFFSVPRQRARSAAEMPGIQGAWSMPIKARIDMLTTGIRTAIGIKVFGADLNEIARLGEALEPILRKVQGTRSVYAERELGGLYLDFLPDREAIARYGLRVADVLAVVESAIGGMRIDRTIEGRERYSVSVRYPRELRDDPEALGRVLVPIGAQASADGAMAGMGVACRRTHRSRAPAGISVCAAVVRSVASRCIAAPRLAREPLSLHS